MQSLSRTVGNVEFPIAASSGRHASLYNKSNASLWVTSTKQEDEDKDKIIADLKNENETLKRQVKEAQDILSGLVNTGMSDHYLGHTGMTVRQLAEKWGLIETKTTKNAKPRRKGMIESMLGAYKSAHPDEQLSEGV